MSRVILETERLLLRPFELSDVESMFKNWTNDSDVTKYMTWNPHGNIEETKRVNKIFVDLYENEDRISFGIVYKSDNELIGAIDVVNYIDGVPVIGYCICKRYWNMGIMTKACSNVIQYIFSLGYDKIRIDAVKENIGSNRVIQKCGGVLFKTQKEFFEKKNQEFIVNSYYIYNKLY